VPGAFPVSLPTGRRTDEGAGNSSNRDHSNSNSIGGTHPITKAIGNTETDMDADEAKANSRTFRRLARILLAAGRYQWRRGG
jgi:hypothetical protein